MISYVIGSLFQSPAQVLVNTVNTVGAMGKGVALEFKNIYPDMFKQYQELCHSGKLKIGTLWIYKSPNKWVLNFPTKTHWRYPSRVEFIEAGLKKFVSSYAEMDIHSIAFPPLGCGHGQLDFESQVQPLMEKYLRNLPIDIFIYPHKDDPIIPEHLHPKEMRDWLRSEPINLPFVEVWDDLVEIFYDQSTFKTIAKDKPFEARISLDPKGIIIISSGDRFVIPYETLIAFWQQLRTYGFSIRQIVPSLSTKIYYLVSVFASLPYVEPVQIADNYSRLRRYPVTGLQILPFAYNRESQATQLPLFDIV